MVEEGNLPPEQVVKAYVLAMRAHAARFQALTASGRHSGLGPLTLLMQEAAMLAEDYWWHPERCFAGGSVGWGNQAAENGAEPEFFVHQRTETFADVEVRPTGPDAGSAAAGDVYRVLCREGVWRIEGQLRAKSAEA